jgi:hypothetical protein
MHTHTVPALTRPRGSSLLGACLLCELPEGRERGWAVHGVRSAVHRGGDAERLGDLRLVAAGADGARNMRLDAAVALRAPRVAGSTGGPPLTW